MRKYALIAAALLLSFSVIAGCSGKSESGSAKVYLKTYMNAWPNSLDPALGQDLYGTTVLDNILEPLIRWDSEANAMKPAGAESWTVSDDGLVYTFKLRDMKWNDGKAVTSGDYAYGIRRCVDPAVASLVASFVFPVENGKDVFEQKADINTLGVFTPDEKTLVIKLQTPLPYFLEMVKYRAYFPQREDWVEKYGDSYATSPETSPQCGPFTLLNDWVLNSSMKFTKNEMFWNASNVKLEEISVSIISEPVSIYSALLSGELDYASVPDPQWQTKFINNSDFKLDKILRTDCVYSLMNCTSPLLKNNKIRQAISIALDREDFIKACRKGFGIPAYAFCPPNLTIQGLPFNELGKGPVADLIAETPDVKGLFVQGLKELGVDPDPAKHTISYLSSGGSTQDNRTESEYLQQVFKEKIGFHLDVILSEWNEFSNRLDRQDFEMAALGWNADFNDPSNFLETAWPQSNTYKTGWNNEEFNGLIVKAQKETNAEKRRELLRRAETILVKEDAAIMPFTTRELQQFAKTFVKGVRIDLLDSMGWQTIDTSERK